MTETYDALLLSDIYLIKDTCVSMMMMIQTERISTKVIHHQRWETISEVLIIIWNRCTKQSSFLCIECTLVTYYIQKKRKTFLVTTLRSSLNGAHSNFIFIIFHHLNQVKEVVLMVR